MVTWMWVVWLLAGLVLVGLEVHTQAFYALFLALGAFVATIVAVFPEPTSGCRPSSAPR